MRSRVGWLGGLVVGCVLGIALVVACGGRRGGGGGDLLDAGGFFDAGLDAQAQTTCERWEVINLVAGNEDLPEVEQFPGGVRIYRGPDGWEPFSGGSNNYVFRRCAN